MKYKLSDIAHFFEIIGGIAIIISLIFVGVQLKENASATKSASAIAATSSMVEWYLELGSSEKNSELFRNFMADPLTLSKAQTFQSIMNLHASMLIHQTNFYLVKEGTLDSEMLDSIAIPLVIIKDFPGFKYYWKMRRDLFLSDFQIYVDSLLKINKNISNDIY